MILNKLEQTILGDLWTSSALWNSLEYLCDGCNGRFAGSDDERRAGDWMLARFREMGLQNVHAEPFEMRGWVRGPGQLALLAGESEQEMPCMALAGSPPGQVEAQVIDIGPGAPADLERLGDAVKGCIVLAGDQPPHRLEKYTLAHQAGAVGFLFANSRPGNLIPAGSLGMG
ncbi:MAG: aminopeptidase, partial [Anaerolineae bacterium]|nr:aminopeptidase [Anaerolineae bacterium]